MVQRLQTIEQGNHIIAVYPTKDEKYNEAFAFLKEGNYQSDFIIRQIGELNQAVHTDDKEPIRRIALHSGGAMEPIIIGAYLEEEYGTDL